jgi:TPR repeat protein
MKRWFPLALTIIVTLGACTRGAGFHPKERPVSDLSAVRANLAFTCVHENDVIPPRDAEADQLYRRARWLYKNNRLKEDPSVYPKMERLMRIATAYGHDKANLELRDMIGRGQAHSNDAVKETLDLTEDLMKRGIPGGYYDMGRYLEQGYGVKQDADLALKYFRKSADLGNPEGQYLVGDKLAKFEPEISRKMLRCAAQQGHGQAAVDLANDLAINKQYQEALVVFQLGVKAGSATAASFLESGFNGPAANDELNYLGQQKDDERVRRYNAIGKILDDYSYLNPKVPEIDAIVPLPQAKLPLWDGKLQWLKEHEANVPPPLPTEERIAEMARAKGLDPATGRPLPKKQAATEPISESKRLAVAAALGIRLPSGTRCPQSGVWRCAHADAAGGSQRTFQAGQTLPEAVVPVPRNVWQKLKGEPAQQLVDTTWTLVGIPEANA